MGEDLSGYAFKLQISAAPVMVPLYLTLFRACVAMGVNVFD